MCDDEEGTKCLPDITESNRKQGCRHEINSSDHLHDMFKERHVYDVRDVNTSLAVPLTGKLCSHLRLTFHKGYGRNR